MAGGSDGLYAVLTVPGPVAAWWPAAGGGGSGGKGFPCDIGAPA